MVLIKQVRLFQQVVSRGLAFIRGNFHNSWELQRRPSGATITQRAPCAGALAPQAPQSHRGMSPAALGPAQGWGQHCHCCHTQPSSWHQLGLLPIYGMAPTLPGHRDHGQWPWAGWPRTWSMETTAMGTMGTMTTGRVITGLGTMGKSTWAVAAQYQQPFSPPGVCGTRDPTLQAGNNEEGTTFLFERLFYTLPNKNSSKKHRHAQHGPSGKENAVLWTKNLYI